MAQAGVAFLAVFLFASLAESSSNLGRGFGDDIAWRTFDEGREESKSSGKPLMLLIHKSWCGACKALKPQMAVSDEIRQWAKYFVMVNVEDDEEPAGEEYSPDGGYIPRILFLTSDGKVDTSLTNPGGSPQYKYFYSDGPSVVSGMKAALKKLSPGSSDEL